MVAVEDLAVVTAMHNRHLSGAIVDIGLGELRRQMWYKARMHGDQMVFVGRLFPSPRLCRKCGSKNNPLASGERTFVCRVCEHKEDRYLHAAGSILREGPLIIKTT